MPIYSYKGTALDGNDVTGRLSATDVEELKSILLDRGILLNQCVPVIPWHQRFILSNFRSGEVTRFTRQFAILLKSEVPVLEALELVIEQVSDRTLQSVLVSVSEEIEAGSSTARAFARHPFLFDTLYVSMLDAGESSGNLDRSLEDIATYREKREAAASKIKSALAYPLLVVFVAVAVVLGLVLYVVPIFSSMYSNFGAELPGLTQGVVEASDYLKENLIAWIAGSVLLVPAVAWGVTRPKAVQVSHRLFLKAPLLGPLAVRTITYRFCRTMGSLLGSGVDIVIAFKIGLRSTGNRHVETALIPSVDRLIEGRSFTDSVESAQLFPRAMLRLTASGEKTGRLGEMLTRAADYFEKESDTQVSTLMSLIEPAIIVVLGVLIAFILVAMYMPLFDLVGTL